MLLSLYNPAGGNVHNPIFLSTRCTAENFIPTYSVFTAGLSTGCLLVIHSFNIHNKLVDFGGKERIRFHFFFYYVARVHDGAVVAVEFPADFRQGPVRQFRGSIHGDLARPGDRLRFAFGIKIFHFNAKTLADYFFNRIDVNG